jgi:hypothetical protein
MEGCGQGREDLAQRSWVPPGGRGEEDSGGDKGKSRGPEGGNCVGPGDNDGVQGALWSWREGPYWREIWGIPYGLDKGPGLCKARCRIDRSGSRRSHEATRPYREGLFWNFPLYPGLGGYKPCLVVPRLSPFSGAPYSLLQNGACHTAAGGVGWGLIQQLVPLPSSWGTLVGAFQGQEVGMGFLVPPPGWGGNAGGTGINNKRRTGGLVGAQKEEMGEEVVKGTRGKWRKRTAPIVPAWCSGSQLRAGHLLSEPQFPQM